MKLHECEISFSPFMNLNSFYGANIRKYSRDIHRIIQYKRLNGQRYYCSNEVLSKTSKQNVSNQKDFIFLII